MTIEEQLANITARLTALERRDIPPVCDVEKEFGINPIPANEGDSRAAESVAIPAGWVECKGHYPSDSRQILHPKTRHIIAWASPNRCVPWGEGYEAILPEDAKRGDEYLAGPEWVAPLDPAAWSASARMAEVWRRKVQPEVGSLADRVADSIADDVQRMQVAIETLTDERDRLRAEVERLKAESTVAAVSVLVDHARGVLMHRYEGACPDSVEGPDVRDPECPVCRAIDSASGRAVALDALRAQKGGGAT